MFNPLRVSLENIIPLTEARDHFSQIVNEVQKDKLYVLTKGGKPAVAIVDVKYLEQITGGNANKEHVVSEIKKDPTKVGLAPMVKHDTNPSSGSFNPPITPKPSTPPPPPPPPPKPNPTPYQPQPLKPVTPPVPRPPMPPYQPSKPTPPPYQPPRPPMTPAPAQSTTPPSTASSTPSSAPYPAPGSRPATTFSPSSSTIPSATPPPAPAPKPAMAQPQDTFEATSAPNLSPYPTSNTNNTPNMPAKPATIDVKPMDDPDDNTENQDALAKQSARDNSRISADDKPGPAQYSNSITSAGDEEPDDMGID